jgi:hypothetical protein
MTDRRKGRTLDCVGVSGKGLCQPDNQTTRQRKVVETNQPKAGLQHPPKDIMSTPPFGPCFAPVSLVSGVVEGILGIQPGLSCMLAHVIALPRLGFCPMWSHGMLAVEVAEPLPGVRVTTTDHYVECEDISPAGSTHIVYVKEYTPETVTHDLPVICYHGKLARLYSS